MEVYNVDICFWADVRDFSAQYLMLVHLNNLRKSLSYPQILAKNYRKYFSKTKLGLGNDGNIIQTALELEKTTTQTVKTISRK